MAQSKPTPIVTAKTDTAPTEKAMSKCPICGAPSVLEARPFCSHRCADVDLSRWLRGAYVIQGASQDDDEDGDGADAPPESAVPSGRRDDTDD